MLTKFARCVGLMLSLTLFSATASAQYIDQKDPMRFESETKKTEMSVSAHFRLITVPDFIVGAFYDEFASSWSDGPNFSYGGEFTFRKKGEYELMFIVDYADLRRANQIWRESDDPTSESRWTEVDLQMLSFVIGSYFVWDVEPWFSPYVGGGIGPGFTLGGVTKYKVDPAGTCYEMGQFAPEGNCVKDGKADLENGFLEPEQEDIPFVIPVLNVAGGARFNIKKYGSVKVELGFQNYFYAGINLGGQW